MKNIHSMFKLLVLTLSITLFTLSYSSAQCSSCVGVGDGSASAVPTCSPSTKSIGPGSYADFPVSPNTDYTFQLGSQSSAATVSGITAYAGTSCSGSTLGFNTTNSPYAISFNSGSSTNIRIVTCRAGTWNSGQSSATLSYKVSSVSPDVFLAPQRTTICSGEQAAFTAYPSFGGSAPLFDFRINGQSQQNSSSGYFASTTINNNDLVTCIMTGNAQCASSSNATSNSVSMTVNPAVTPTVSVSASQSAICPGTAVTFTASVTNEGSSPYYQWYVNNTPVNGVNGPSYTSSNLSNGDAVYVDLYSSVTCPSSSVVSSSPVTITVYPVVSPLVSLSASQTTICSGTAVAFTATPTDGGSAPTYEFFVNGSSAQNSASATFTSSTLNNNDAVSCVMTGNAPCASHGTSSSSSIFMTVSASVTPSVSLSASQTSICGGQAVTFTASPTNGGSSPTYEFFVNGTSMQSGANTTYSSSTLGNGDAVTCAMTSNATCAVPATVNSNTVNITYNPALTPAVSLSASLTSICGGQSVTFTAAATNGGSAPAYQFFLNGNSVQSGSSNTYSSSTLANGDAVTCTLTSNAPCASPLTAGSNTVTITYNPVVVPSVSLSASQTSICVGQAISFTASAVNGGSAPTYEFFVNGSSVQNSASSSYTISTLANGDAVTCALTSNAPCASPLTVSSSAVTITVNAPVTPTVSLSASQTTECAGTAVSFTASGTNGGPAPTYEFFVNGNSVQNSASTSYTSSTLANGSAVTCAITSNATCLTAATVSSSAVTITVNAPVTPTVSLSASQTTVCAGTAVSFTASGTNGGPAPTYEFFVNGNSVQNSASTSYTSSTLANGSAVTCTITSNATCLTAATVSSSAVTITVNAPVTPTVSLSASQTTVCAGTAVSFTASGTNGGPAPTYEFFVNGNSVQNSASTSYTSSTLANGSAVTCAITSNATCLTAATVSSSAVTITVNAPVTPTVSLSASQTTVCAGTAVSFTASGTNGGPAPTYEFFVNGNSVQNSASTSYTSSTLANGSAVTCAITSNATCLTAATVSSSSVTITVNPTIVPTVSLSATQTRICNGTSVSFTAAGTNGGISPVYTFSVNGNNVQSGSSSTYTSAALTNGAVVRVSILSNATCASANAANSNSITMTVNPQVTSSVTRTICQSASYAGHNTSGTYVDHYTSAAGCDSARTLILTVIPNINTSVTLTLCSGSSYAGHSATGTYSDYYTSSVTGCDSVRLLRLTVVSSITTTVTTSICTGSSYAGHTTSGTYVDHYTALGGCDSARTVNLTVKPNVTSNLTVSICQGASYAGHTASGTYVDHYTSAAGCDSARTVTLTVLPTASFTVTTTLCSGSSYAGHTASGTYVDHYTSVNGCDSARTLNLTIITIATTVTTTICQGGSYAGHTSTGTFVDHYTSVTGCDSARTLNLTLFFKSSSSRFDTIASGSSIVVGGQTFTSAGTYNVTVAGGSANGCDSIITLYLSVNSSACIPTIGISSNTNSPCSAVTFTATVINPGTNPTYQWYKNNLAVGTNSTTYSASSLNYRDSIALRITTTGCGVTRVVVSNKIYMTGTSGISPSESISANNTNLDLGGTIAITATPTNAGTTPVYAWYKNNVLITGSTSYLLQLNASSLGNGDQIYGTMTSSNCGFSQTVTSNTVSFTKSGSSAKEIVTITMPNEVRAATIVSATASVYDTTTLIPSQRTAIHPVRMTVSTSAAYSPSITTNRDFSGPVTYNVLAQNGTTKLWTIYCVGPNGLKTSSPNGISEPVIADMKLYPDPASSYIIVSTAGGDEGAIVTLTDINGKVMYHHQLHPTATVNHMIDVSSYAVGTYIIHIAVGDRSETRQFVINR